MEEKDVNSLDIGTNADEANEEDSKTKGEPGSLREKWKNPVFREKLIYSLLLSAVFVGFGLNAGQHGATFLDMQIITNTDIEAASVFFTATNAGYLTGAILTGILYNKVNKTLLMFVASLGLGISNIFVPYCNKYILMIFMRYTTAVFGGCITSGGHSEHMRMWGSEANELLQFIEFCFSFGGFISPLIAEPFLAEKEHTNKTQGVIVERGVHANTTNSESLRSTETEVHYLFLIVGIYSIIVSIPFLGVYARDRGRSRQGRKAEKRRFSRKGVPVLILIVMLFGMCLIYFTYCCVEDSFFSFLMTFLVKEYDSVSKTKGALTTAIAWASFALSRLLMIFMTKILNTVQLLFLIMISMSVALSSFTIFAHFGVVDALIVFSAVSALTFSGVFASGFCWMETEMFQVTGIVSSCILVASSSGSIINPLIIGYLMQEVGNMWFCYLLTIDSFALCILFIVLFIFSRYYVDKNYGSLASSLKDRSLMVKNPLENLDSDTIRDETEDDKQYNDAHVKFM